MNSVTSDYCGYIAKVDKTEGIDGANNIQVAYVLGEPVIVSKEIKEGFIGLFFPPDTKLSDDYLKLNNLYRQSDKNNDKDKSGFFDNNGRVRAQPFLKVKSCGYFADIGSLSFTQYDITKLNVGDRFEELNGFKIAEKYINPNTVKNTNSNKQARKQAETPIFKQHVDTDQYKYHSRSIPKGALISIQAKGHGTSGRYSHTKVIKEKQYPNNITGKIFKLLDKLRNKDKEAFEEWEYVVGTRRVVLEDHEQDKESYHGPESFRFEILEKLKPHLDQGVTIYGEIVGYVNGEPIMGQHDVTKLKDKCYTKKYGKSIIYKYGCMQETFKFYAYRVTITSNSGIEIDLLPNQLKQWCEHRGIEYALDLVEPFIYDGNEQKLNELVEQLTEREDVLCEDYRDPSHISEGVVVRVDHYGLVPKFYKSKSTPFRIMEGIYKENNVDLEDAS